MDLTGRKLAQFEIRGKLGEGGMDLPSAPGLYPCSSVSIRGPIFPIPIYFALGNNSVII